MIFYYEFLSLDKRTRGKENKHYDETKLFLFTTEQLII